MFNPPDAGILSLRENANAFCRGCLRATAIRLFGLPPVFCSVECGARWGILRELHDEQTAVSQN